MNALFASQLSGTIKAKILGRTQELDMMEWMSRVALEFIGQGGLGYSFNALDEDARNKYAETVRQFT